MFQYMEEQMAKIKIILKEAKDCQKSYANARRIYRSYKEDDEVCKFSLH